MSSENETAPAVHKYAVTNASKNHRVIFTKAKTSGHLVPMGQSLEIEMTEAEALNAHAPGLSIKPASQAALEPVEEAKTEAEEPHAKRGGGKHKAER